MRISRIQRLRQLAVAAGFALLTLTAQMKPPMTGSGML